MKQISVFLLIIIYQLFNTTSSNNIKATEVFIYPITPQLFNWTEETTAEFSYRASLVHSPDLPSWLNYVYSAKHKTGFLYGAPPQFENDFQIEIIAWNHLNYETRRTIVQLNITSKSSDLAKNEVQIKIDNLNLDDMFEDHRIQNLIQVFTTVLWTESSSNLYMTFLDSALKFGARLPLSPSDGDGVVVHLGSSVEFSESLLILQDEVKPLRKLPHCPRDFKRTTVDRHFRQMGFSLDWCYFKLTRRWDKEGSDIAEPAGQSDWGWELPERSKLPGRNFQKDFLTTLVIPITILTILVLALSFTLCFHHDKLQDDYSDSYFDAIFEPLVKLCRRKNEEPDEKIIQYETVQRATTTLRSMSNKRDTQSSPRISGVESSARDSCRPSPPPYGATSRRVIHPDSS